MYIPEHFREERVEVLHALVREHSFAALVTIGPDGDLRATHLPMILDAEPAPLGTLRGHVAVGNTQWRDSKALAIFQGPSAYISPSWYAAKQETGRVVPTYNYAVVHAYGRLRTFTDPVVLERHLRALTAHHEAGFAEPWSVEDAPPEYIRGLLKGIVGIEMPISRLEGKWKMSQNRSVTDREGVARGLRAVADLVDRQAR